MSVVVHLYVVHPAFSLPITASPTLQGALEDGFGEADVACDMPEPCKILSLHSCQKRFLWTSKEVDIAPHPIVGLVLQAGIPDLFPQAFGFEGLDPFLRVSKQGSCFTAVKKDEGFKTLVQLKLVCKADGVAPPGPA